jgi:hypothetical protein
MAMIDPDDEQLQQINDQTRDFPAPSGDGYIDRDLSREAISQFGVPPRPDPDALPELSALWEQMVNRPLRQIRVEGRFEWTPARGENFQRAGATVAPAAHQDSLNWSGASLTPRNGQMFTNIVGVWRVPFLADPPDGREYHCSTWIGLDGQREYLDSTLPQVGTAQYVSTVNGAFARTFESWFEWWPLDPVTLPKLVIQPGDEIVCWLRVINAHCVQFFILNLGEAGLAGLLGADFVAFKWPTPARAWRDGPAVIQTRVAGATAEWIMERPTRLHSEALYELPDYNAPAPAAVRKPFQFRHCYAVSAHSPAEVGFLQPLRSAMLIDMFKRENDPYRTVKISMASRNGDFGCGTSYRF